MFSHKFIIYSVFISQLNEVPTQLLYSLLIYVFGVLIELLHINKMRCCFAIALMTEIPCIV